MDKFSRIPKMSVHLIKRLIKSKGRQYEFKMPVKDEFGKMERDVDGKIVFAPVSTLGCFYHEVGIYFGSNALESSQVRNKPEPMLLTLIDENSKLINQDCFVEIENNLYKVIVCNDIQEWGVFMDISLEVFDFGESRW